MASDGHSYREDLIIKDSKNTTDSQDQVIIFINPIYLHPGENVIVVLVAPPLDDNNYHNLSKSTWRALTTKNKLGFINGSLFKPFPSHQDFELWECANNMVLSWINHFISQHIAQSTIYFASAFDL